MNIHKYSAIFHKSPHTPENGIGLQLEDGFNKWLSDGTKIYVTENTITNFIELLPANANLYISHADGSGYPVVHIQVNKDRSGFELCYLSSDFDKFYPLDKSPHSVMQWLKRAESRELNNASLAEKMSKSMMYEDKQ